MIEEYIYDDNGNRLQSVVRGITTSYSYDIQDRLNSAGGKSYSYNANGELVGVSGSGGSKEFSYNAFGYLRSTQVGVKAIEYILDARNNRIGKKVNGVLKQRFVYNGRGQVIAELSEDSEVRLFSYATHVNAPNAMRVGSEVYYLVLDHIGSVLMVINTRTGAVVQELEYDAFGNVLRDTNPGFQPFGFAGGVYDVDTGLVRFGARDYDPETGRWTSKDPILFAGGDTNLYGYTFNDPVNFIDPSGLAVGDWWDLPANFGRAREIANEEHANWAGNHNNWGDAMRHYEWSRRTTAETNSFTAFTAGWAHEIEYFFRRGRMPAGQYLRESWMDVNNNSLGRNSGRNGNLMCPSNLSTQPGTGY